MFLRVVGFEFLWSSTILHIAGAGGRGAVLNLLIVPRYIFLDVAYAGIHGKANS